MQAANHILINKKTISTIYPNEIKLFKDSPGNSGTNKIPKIFETVQSGCKGIIIVVARTTPKEGEEMIDPILKQLTPSQISFELMNSLASLNDEEEKKKLLKSYAEFSRIIPLDIIFEATIEQIKEKAKIYIPKFFEGEESLKVSLVQNAKKTTNHWL